MKNKYFIQILDRVNPNEEQKERILKQVLIGQEKKNKKNIYIWKYGIAIAYVCVFCFIMNGFFQEETLKPSPVSHQSRVYVEEENKLEFCYKNNCYQEIGITNNIEHFEFIETIFDIRTDTLVNIYQGEIGDTIIIEYDNSYFLYQKLEDSNN